MNSKIPLRKRYYRDISRLGALVLLVSMVVLTGFNYMEYMEQSADQTEEFWEMLVLFAALMAVFPFMFWMAWVTSGKLLGPLREFRDAVDRMRLGDLDARIVSGEGSNELTELLGHVEEAFEAHREALRRLERFSSDVAHQLRTPLTAMRTAGEACLGRERSPEAYRETIGRLLEQSDRLSQVVDQLLLLARVGREKSGDQMRAVDLKDLTQEVLAEFTPLWEDRGVSVSMEMESAPVWGNPVWLSEALRNLLNNATLYTPDPAKFLIELRKTPEGVDWSVSDSGPGIPEARRERIFDRFERGAAPSDGGTGLGLAIVQEVARVHGGALHLETSTWGGCRFVLRIPGV